MTLASCATMVNGTTQVIPVTSSPPGARVSIDSIPVGVTPLLATVSRKQSHLVSITHDSFPAVHIALERHVSPWVLGSLLLYGVPTLYDFSSGGAYEFLSDTLRAGVPGSDTPGYPGYTRDTYIPTRTRVTAAVFSATLGFGLGHKMIGSDAVGSTFRLTQLGGMAAATVGLGLGFGGEAVGLPIFWGGVGTYLGSRVWEIIDVIVRPTARNASVNAKNRTAATRAFLARRGRP